ncbi:RAD55 family ATPase [Haloarchaeobius sp. HRN-SO-5]|uniref:RAD55 family ATPase n=1 Tax=Haloarchaeobius sp. HRN-SO-5 TaxID=3446118 RepID=UPI003EBE3885
MYELTDVLPDAELAPGTNVLIAGGSLSANRRVALDFLASGAERGEGSIVVTAEDSAEKMLDEFSTRLDGVDPVDVGVVDCVSSNRGVGEVTDDAHVKYASSPVDVTDIGVTLSEFLEEFSEGRGHERNRVLLHSVSTLLLYSDLQTVFRFLHVFTGRVQSADGLGVYVIDSTAHDEQTLNTLRQLFDAVVEVTETEGDGPKLDTTGISTR